MIKAIIFDCFGVIITDALQAWLAELRASGEGVVANQIVDIVRANNRGLIEPTESSRQIGELLGIGAAGYRSRIDQGEVKDVALLEYIVELRKSYKTAVLSNIGKSSLERRFADGELPRCFDVVVASGEIGFAKPEPQAYALTADRLGVRLDECIFTDDRPDYTEAARAMGMQTIGYQTRAQFKAELQTMLAQSRA